jgi:ABC-type oligopeptide transport system substrate-binding subunit
MKMKNRFALIALLGSLMASALVMGCGGNAEDTSATGGNTANATNGTSPGAAKDAD